MALKTDFRSLNSFFVFSGQLSRWANQINIRTKKQAADVTHCLALARKVSHWLRHATFQVNQQQSQEEPL
jgi:hypothetical protein